MFKTRHLRIKKSLFNNYKMFNIQVHFKNNFLWIIKCLVLNTHGIFRFLYICIFRLLYFFIFDFTISLFLYFSTFRFLYFLIFAFLYFLIFPSEFRSQDSQTNTCPAIRISFFSILSFSKHTLNLNIALRDN